MREFSLLQHVYESNPALAKNVVIPPGDDLAMVTLGGHDLLAGVDQLIAGRHVDLDTTPLELVGRKALARSLSDVAAMAARPVAALVAVALPPDFGESQATALFDAIRRAGDQFHCPLIGGDIAILSDRAHPLTCSVTVFAEPGPAGPRRRSDARPGDAVYVTGRLGGAMDHAGDETDAVFSGYPHHVTFRPRIAEALELAERLGDRLGAIIDISDGLGRDADHIAEASNVMIEIDAVHLPCRVEGDWQRALGDGEDYELCFTARGPVPEVLNGGGRPVPVTAIGRVLEAKPGEIRCAVNTPDGNRVDASQRGWEHRA